jgi:hypothetical protein
VETRKIVTQGISTGLRLGRGTADRVVKLAGPPLGRLSDKVVSRVRRAAPDTTTTFIPSKQPTDDAPEPSAGTESRPSPATVARNIGPQRPSAKPPRPAKPKSGPGAKLPPPRASTS